MLFCPPENKINTPAVLKSLGCDLKQDIIPRLEKLLPPTPTPCSVNAYFPLHGDGEAAADGGAAHCSAPLGLWQMRPSYCSTLITLHVEGSAARTWGEAGRFYHANAQCGLRSPDEDGWINTTMNMAVCAVTHWLIFHRTAVTTDGGCLPLMNRLSSQVGRTNRVIKQSAGVIIHAQS